jgi:predicted DCC family thiol-disulfide oxidoreductase YuxK
VEAAAILYDADCGFCRWSLAQLLRLDRRSRLRPVPLQQPEADILLSGMAREQRMASWHLVGSDGQVYSGGDAFAPLLRLIPGGSAFAGVLAAFPSLCDVAYRTVAGRRSWLGRLIPAASAARARQRVEAAANAGKGGASATSEHAVLGPQGGKAARQTQSS